MTSMERQTSVDDLLGGFWRGLGQGGMGRTDSEAAFQEFLKRIPSTTNLAAAVAESSQAAQQIASSQPTASTSTAPTVGSSLPDVVTAVAAAGIPRVPSLGLFRQLAFPAPALPTSHTAPAATSSNVKTEPPSAAASAAPPFRLPEPAEALKVAPPTLPAPVALPAASPLPTPYSLPTAALTGIPALSDLASLSAVGAAALQGVPAFATQPNPLAAAAGLTPAAAAAAALQLGNLGQLGARISGASAAAAAAISGSDRDMDKVDQRRARR